MKMSFEDRCKQVQEAAQNGECLKEFTSRGSSVFEDPEYGEFTANYYVFLKGKSVHPKRRDWSHNKKRVQKSLEEGQSILNKKGWSCLKVIKWNGLVSSKAIFLDSQYGEFSGVFREVLRGRAKHPDRLHQERSDRSIQKWKDKGYKNKVIKGIKTSSKDPVKSRKETLKEKYGAEFPLQIDKFKKKKEETTLDRYGVKHYAQTQKFQDSFKEVNPFLHDKEKVYQARIDSGNIFTFSGKTMGEYANDLGKAYTTFQSQVKKYGVDVALKIANKESSLELAIASILDELGASYETEVRIGKYIADFLVEGKFVIEADGGFWHSDYVIEDRYYHKKKRQAYNESGYDALFFREDEIVSKKHVVDSIIRNKLHMNSKIGARSTKIQNLSTKEANVFFEENHLMGKGAGKCIGLIYEDEVVCAIRYRRHKTSLKIDRFCTKNGLSVIGGYSKLLKELDKVEAYGKIINFIDLRYGSGEFLEAFGFKPVSSDLSFKWTASGKFFHRMKYPGNSGYDHGFNKIWDCGQKKFEFIKNFS